MPEAARPPSVTLHDVARHAGVSLITASRALGNPAVVAPSTIEKVRQAVIATGYIPNLLAGGLKSKRSMTVAALVPIISVPQFLPTVQSLTEELAKAGYQLILGQSGYDRAREAPLLNTMISRRVDAIVVAGLLGADAEAAKLKALGIPIVETWDFSEQPIDMLVGFSHPAVGRAVARFFQLKPWKRVGIASADDQRALQRLAGFKSSIGRPVVEALVPAPSTLASGRQALAHLLAQDSRLEAVACSSDALAAGVATEARARGLRVPEDLAICGFGDAEFAAHWLPALTTVHIDGALIGQRAAQMLVDRCRGLPVDPRIVDVGFKIIERASTAV